MMMQIWKLLLEFDQKVHVSVILDQAQVFKLSESNQVNEK